MEAFGSLSHLKVARGTGSGLPENELQFQAREKFDGAESQCTCKIILVSNVCQI